MEARNLSKRQDKTSRRVLVLGVQASCVLSIHIMTRLNFASSPRVLPILKSISVRWLKSTSRLAGLTQILSPRGAPAVGNAGDMQLLAG